MQLPMLHIPRARRPVLASGYPVRPRPGSSIFACACLGAAALGCSSAAPPPESPTAAAMASEEPTAPVEAPADEPSPSAPVEPDASLEPSAETPASSAAARPQRDSRGKPEIQQVMADNRGKVRACYDAALVKNPGIAGDLVIDFTIDPHGDVKQADVNWSQSEIHIPELDTCAADAVRSLKFPASSRGLESKVSYPFNFNPPRGGAPGSGSASPNPSSSK